MPPFENLSPKVLADFSDEGREDSHPGLKNFALEANAADLNASVRSLHLDEKQEADLVDCIVETKTGFKFPLFLSPNSFKGPDHSVTPQALVGVGLRSISIIKLKTIKIYAFGLYIKPENLRAQLGEKYAAVAPEELKLKLSFYDDLLRHELDMTVRLIVHYKRIKIGMVRSAFETSLKNRLKKLKGVDDDEGLHIFSSYFTEDLALPQGTVIDFHWQPGGKFRTKVGDRDMGTICSLDFCRAFFDLYIGEPPVCATAKQAMGLKLGQMFRAT